MRRTFLFLTIVCLIPASVRAQDRSDDPLDKRDDKDPSALTRFLERPRPERTRPLSIYDQSERERSPGFEAANSSQGIVRYVNSGFLDYDRRSNDFIEGADFLADDVGLCRPQPSDFYPVCDHDCTIGCLDNWCDNDCGCCTTDEWCQHPCSGPRGNCYIGEDGSWYCNDVQGDVSGDEFQYAQSAIRLGWWGTTTKGSPQKVGEYQSLSSSPFWDVDMIRSDGSRTLDLVLSGLDNEANNARLNYYGPGMTGKFKYDRFFRRWDHDPLTGTPYLPGTPFPPGGQALPGDVGNVRAQDLNVGENYAIRVQQLDAKFQGDLMENVKWKLNLWGMRKSGERQANAVAHCFNGNAPAAPGLNGNTCHILSQRQNIDWLTMEIQPGIEARFESATVEYLHTIRSFGQSDQIVDRSYTRFNFTPASGTLGPDYNYAMVPENITQIDQIKVGASLTPTNEFYGVAFHGDTHNELRDTHRRFDAFDARITNTAIDKVTLTGYANMYFEDNQLPPSLFASPPLGPSLPPPPVGPVDNQFLRHPVDYQRTRTGLRSAWKPFQDRDDLEGDDERWRTLSIVSGYEYYFLGRNFAVYPTALGTFRQPDTTTHLIELGPSMQWNSSFYNYVRYKGRLIEDPLVGVRENNGRFNSNQPEQDHRIEIGGTWTPSSDFMATAQFSIVNSWQHSQFARFDENSYPMVFTLWHAPTDRLSLTAGYAYFSNWIDQDTTLGFTVPNAPVPPLRTETTPWSYDGQNHLVSLNANYAWTSTVSLVGGMEWNRGTNVFSIPASPAGADWSLVPSLAGVIVETQRYTAGFDWMPYNNVNFYARYVYFDYQDNSRTYDSGTSHMALAGSSIVW